MFACINLAYAQSSAPVLQVKTVLAKAQSVEVSRSGLGNVQSLASVTVRTRLDGQIAKIAFEEGQDVKAGQLLARIDPRIYEAQLAQAEAQKAKDQVALANAKSDLQRFAQLIKEDAATQQQLDTQTALVAQIEAALKADDAQISLAKVQLSYTEISSPISGRTGARLVDAGNIVRAADANGLVVINQIDPIAVQFTFPEAEFQAVNDAMRSSSKPLRVQAIDRASGQVLSEGQLALVNNQIDATSGSFILKGRFANAKHKLWPGQSVNVRMILGERKDSIIVPSAAVQRSQSGFFVYVVGEGDKVRMQPCKVAQQENGMSVIEGALKEGDRVVVDGMYRLLPGSRVAEVGSGNKP